MIIFCSHYGMITSTYTRTYFLFLFLRINQEVMSGIDYKPLPVNRPLAMLENCRQTGQATLTEQEKIVVAVTNILVTKTRINFFLSEI